MIGFETDQIQVRRFLLIRIVTNGSLGLQPLTPLANMEEKPEVVRPKPPI